MKTALVSFTSLLNAWCYDYNERKHYGPDDFTVNIKTLLPAADLIVFGCTRAHVFTESIPSEVSWLNQDKERKFTAQCHPSDIDTELLPLWYSYLNELLAADSRGVLEFRDDGGLHSVYTSYWDLAQALRDEDFIVPQFTLLRGS